jgi:hypothetical protein
MAVSGLRVSKPELGLCLQILVSKLELKKNIEWDITLKTFLVSG